MYQYYFILGNHPEISLAEIEAVLHKDNINYSIKTKIENFLIIETKQQLNCQQLKQTLAGTIKIGIILKTDKNITSELLLLLLPKTDKRINFGISTYGFDKKIEKLGQQLRIQAKNKDQQTRFISSRENPLNSVIVQKNILNKSGIEFCLFKIDDDYLIGQTQIVQDYNKFSKMDYGRPDRDSQIGMLPPKLAQIMVNLSQVNIKGTLLDPFCGKGTVLQQAALLDYKKLIGTDIDIKQIKSTENNLNWLKENQKLDFQYTLIHSNIEDLIGSIENQSIDLIVTEPHMGPGLHGNEKVSRIKKNMAELEILYKKTFSVYQKILKQDGKVIMIIPSFKKGDKILEFDIKLLLQNKLKIIKKFQYTRDNQHIIRNIYILKK